MVSTLAPTYTLEEWLADPPDQREWIDGVLREKPGMTLSHSEIQLTLGSLWRSYSLSSEQGGKAYTEPPCRTIKQGRRPDVAYLPRDLAERFHQEASLPQVFPLMAEIASPTDYAEEFLNRAQEYLQSPGGQEVWLIFPSSRLIMILTQTQHLIFGPGEIVSTQDVLPGFRVSLDELLS